MSYEVELDNLPVGYMHSVEKDGRANVVVREFTSSEDGDLFISRLDGIPSDLISKLPPSIGVRPSTIDHMLAVIRLDKSATIYINELNLLVQTRAKRPDLKVGDFIYPDDIADILRLSLGDVQVPADAGVLFVFSVGWRKGLYYDFVPLKYPSSNQEYDLETLLGYHFAYLSHQHLFKVSEPEWEYLFEQQWFPFITLKNATTEDILNRVRNQLEVDDLLHKIAEEVSDSLDAMLERWRKSSFLEPHLELVEHAVQRYQAEDYVSSTSIIYPRIEGVMRTLYFHLDTGKSASQKNLVASVVEARQEQSHGHSLLLPQMFRKYLENVYFASFSPGEPAKISRHSIAHGVADSKDFSLKAATLGLLILDQLFYYLPIGQVDRND